MLPGTRVRVPGGCGPLAACETAPAPPRPRRTRSAFGGRHAAPVMPVCCARPPTTGCAAAAQLTLGHAWNSEEKSRDTKCDSFGFQKSYYTGLEWDHLCYLLYHDGYRSLVVKKHIEMPNIAISLLAHT